MKMISFWFVFLLVLVPLFCLAEDSNGPLKVGIVLSLTGDEIRDGEIQRNSFLLAADEINRAGGVNGRPISLIIEDDNGQADLAGLAAKKLIVQDRVLILTGCTESESAMAISAVAEQNKVPFLITSGSIDELTEHGWKYVFRIGPPLSRYFPPLLSFLENVVKPETLAIISENTLYGRRSADRIAKAFQKTGKKVISRESFRIGATDFRPMLARVKNANPDVVFISASTIEGGLLLRQSRELNLAPKIFAGAAEGFTMSDFVLAAGVAAEHVFFIDIWSPNLRYAGAQKYFHDYVMRYLSSTNYYGAEAYACVQVIADALKRTKSLGTDDIRHALAGTNMETVFGPVRFVSEDKKTQQNFVPPFLGQWIGGIIEIVWPKELATAPYVYPVPRFPSKP